MEDLLEQANEIQDSLSRSYAVPDEIDEADLEAGKCFTDNKWGVMLTKHLELDALQFEEEEEGPSYLADLNKAPDFIDETPIEQTEVWHTYLMLNGLLNDFHPLLGAGEGSSEDKCMK